VTLKHIVSNFADFLVLSRYLACFNLVEGLTMRSGT